LPHTHPYLRYLPFATELSRKMLYFPEKRQKKLKIKELIIEFSDKEKLWLSLIKGQFPGKQIDENTEVLIDMKKAKRWHKSVHDSKDKGTFVDFLLWHQILAKVGMFKNVNEMYEKWYKVLKEEAKFLDGLYSKEKKEGKGTQVVDNEDKRICIKVGLKLVLKIWRYKINRTFERMAYDIMFNPDTRIR
jgi:hypothetical protein